MFLLIGRIDNVCVCLGVNGRSEVIEVSYAFSCCMLGIMIEWISEWVLSIRGCPHALFAPLLGVKGDMMYGMYLEQYVKKELIAWLRVSWSASAGKSSRNVGR